MKQRAPRVLWTEEDSQRLVALRRDERPMAEIARELGRGEASCYERLRTLGVVGERLVRGSGKEPPPPPRRCLKCRQAFDPPGRYIFRCKRCRAMAEDIAA